jgi:hypothetical protein
MSNDQNNNGRFDIYTLIHKGLRSFMSDTVTAVGRIDESDPAEVAAGIAQVRRLLEICREHLFVENQFVHPAMEARRPGSSCTTSAEHVHHEESFERLEAQVRAVERSSGDKRKNALLALYRMLALFVAENFQHMNVEECENSEVLWSAYTDEELVVIHKSILAAVPPDLMRENIRWMLPNIPHTDRVHMLAGARHSMPAPAFEGVLNLVKAHVPENDWSKLKSALVLAAVPA